MLRQDCKKNRKKVITSACIWGGGSQKIFFNKSNKYFKLNIDISYLFILNFKVR